jgi:Co/Zn/Cd efflux system component
MIRRRGPLTPRRRRPLVEAPQASTLRYSADGQRFQKALWLIAALALLFCVISLVTDWVTASGSYLSDGSPWIYDTLIYGLVAVSFDRGALLERASAVLLSITLAVAGCQGSYDIWSEIARRAPEISTDSSISGTVLAAGAVLEASLLFRFRRSREPLMKAAWFSARNSAMIGLAGAVVPLLSHVHAAADPQIVVDCLDTFLAFQAAFLVARESVET